MQYWNAPTVHTSAAVQGLLGNFAGSGGAPMFESTAASQRWEIPPSATSNGVSCCVVQPPIRTPT